MHHTKNKRYS
ncbi:hypothetical protein YPPY63_0509, partial [Yersinia pestis PY-63]